MSLKAVLFDFNGVIINDEPIHQQLIEAILLEEELKPELGAYKKCCLGRSDRACLADLFASHGRPLNPDSLDALIARKANAYQRRLAEIHPLPIYPGLEDLIFKLRSAQLVMAVVSGALRVEIEHVLERANLRQHFSTIVAGDDIKTSKPEPDGYLLAVQHLNQATPSLNLKSSECLVIEDTFAGIEAAKRASMPVVGVANTYPFHMLQRQANWTVDYLTDLELDRVQQFFVDG